MAPILLSRSEIDDTRWDQAVACSSQHVVYAFSWYLDLVCEDWNAIVWPSAANYQVILPLPIKVKWGVKVVEQPFFCQYLGFFYQKDISNKIVADFLTLADLHFVYISSYFFNPHNTGIVRCLPAQFRISTHFTNWLSLEASYEEIFTNYSKDRKANLKRSTGFNWSFHQINDIFPLISLFKQNHESGISGGVAADSYLKLEQLYEGLNKRGMATLLYASKGDHFKAGTLIVESGQTGIYLFNAADTEGRSGNARTFLLDQYFRKNAGRNLIFDFESPPVGSIVSFYDSFGSEKKPFISIHKNGLPFPFNLLQQWRRVFFKTKQSLFLRLCRI